MLKSMYEWVFAKGCMNKHKTVLVCNKPEFSSLTAPYLDATKEETYIWEANNDQIAV